MSRDALAPAAEEAIAWMVRLRNGHTDAHQQALFQQWLEQAPAHAHAWAQLQRGLGGHYDIVSRAPKPCARACCNTNQAAATCCAAWSASACSVAGSGSAAAASQARR